MKKHLPFTVAGVFLCLHLLQVPAHAEESLNAVLDSSSYWRTFFVLRPPVVRDGQQLRKLTTLTGDGALPPGDWTSATFDDGAWARIPGRTFPVTERFFGVDEAVLDAGITYYEHSSPALALLCLRGKVQVTSPAAMKLAVKYRGGVVVYVNGKEVGRAHIGKDGLGAEALAEDYPRSAFVTSDGFLLSVESAKKNPAEVKAGWKERVRAAEISIPASALVKGVNVIAIEVHRAPQIPEVESGVKRMSSQVEMPRHLWATCAFLGATLTTSDAGAVVPNRGRPRGFQVWNSQLLNPDFDIDYGDPNEPIRPIRISATRNGSFSGKVVVGSDQAIKGLKAQVSDLAGEKGGRIPAAAVRVRYALSSGTQPLLYGGRYPVLPDMMDALSDTPPATLEVQKKSGDKAANWVYGAVMPVWATVLVPRDTPPGLYTGKLTLAADGVPAVEVPMEVRVSGYVLPPPASFRTVVDLMQSPETVALYYKVPLYGDKHFQYLEKSFDCLGYVGNWTVHIPLIARTNLGNEQTMVRWIKQTDGGYKFDFTVMDRYLDTAIGHMGKPRMVVLWVYDMFLGREGSAHPQMAALYSGTTEIPVSALNESTKEVTTITVGNYDDQGKPTWKALTTELMDHLKQRGLEQNVIIGAGNDIYAPADIIKFWKEVLPNATWARYCHMAVESLGSAKGEIGLQAYCITFRYMADAFNGKYSCLGWKRPDFPGGIYYLRTDGPANFRLPWEVARLLPSISIIGGWRGFGRSGLDYWPCLGNPKAQEGRAAGVLHGRYPESFWRQLEMQIEAYSAPGPNGAMVTAQIELTREGLQEAEARILLEGALDEKKVTGDVAQRCQAALDEHARGLLPLMEVEAVAGYGQDQYSRAHGKYAAWLDGFNNNKYYPEQAGICHRSFMAGGWADRAAKLFDMAGETAERK